MIISSQKYISNEILNGKMEVLAANRPEEIVLETWIVGTDNLEILFDGHHTLEAARQLDIPVRFSAIVHPEGLTGEDLLEQAWLDSEWYNVETGKLVF